MKIVPVPDWFLGKDVIIESFSFLVLLSFFFLCWRNYKLNKNKKVFYLGGGFLLIAFAQLATILTKVVLYYDSVVTRNIGLAVITYHVVKSVDIFYYIGFFFQRFLTLAGLYFMYRFPSARKPETEDILIATSFVLISAIFGHWSYFVFPLASILLIGMIINKYYNIYKVSHLENTRMLIIAFFVLAIANIPLLCCPNNYAYVTSSLLELVSYIILVLLIIRILRAGKYGKKKKQDRNNP